MHAYWCLFSAVEITAFLYAIGVSHSLCYKSKEDAELCIDVEGIAAVPMPPSKPLIFGFVNPIITMTFSVKSDNGFG